MTEQPAKVTVTLNIPGPDSPGYLRRVLRLSEMLAKIEQINSAGQQSSRDLVGLVGEMVDFLEPYVLASDGVNPRDALLDMSQNEFISLSTALRDGGLAPLSPLASEEPSDPGPEEEGQSESPSG